MFRDGTIGRRLLQASRHNQPVSPPDRFAEPVSCPDWLESYPAVSLAVTPGLRALVEKS
jgi:hypothetical protein